jgi:hypothetical protein
MVQLHTKFRTHIFTVSLIISIKQKAKYSFHPPAMLFYSLQACFEDLLPYVISGTYIKYHSDPNVRASTM